MNLLGRTTTNKFVTSSSFARRRLMSAATGARVCDDGLTQRITTTTSSFQKTNNVASRQQRLRTMSSSVVVTQTKAGEVTQPPSPSLSPSSPPLTTTTASIQSDAAQQQAPPVIVTPSCFQRLQYLLQQRNKTPDTMYLRVFVDAGGCSGFQYKFDLIEDEKEAVDPEQDVVVMPNNDVASSNGLRVVVDQTSLEYMKGATVDYVQQMIKSAFSVTQNPQSESACGCGSSFAVKNFSANPAMD